MVFLHQHRQYQHGHECIVPIVQFLSAGEKSDVQSIENSNRRHEQIHQSPQNKEQSEDQIDLHERHECPFGGDSWADHGEDNDEEVEPAGMLDAFAV